VIAESVHRITVPRKGRMACIPPHRDVVRAEVAAREDYPLPGLWQQFNYDAKGDLLYGDKRVLDWVERHDAVVGHRCGLCVGGDRAARC
jgi:hypothetical protein